MEKQWLTDKEVSGITGRAVQTLRNDRNLGKGIPYSKTGRMVRYNLDDVRAFMEAGRVETRPL